MMRIFLILFIFTAFLYGCSDKEEKASAYGRLSVYLYKIEKGDTVKKILEKYPDLQIGLIYYDPSDDTYRAVDPRKGFEKLGYSEAYNKEVYYYIMYRLTQKALKEENKFVEKQLMETLKAYQQFLIEAKKTQQKNREVMQMVLKYGNIGIVLFFVITGVGIAYLLITIAKKHKVI
ncbi:hypothetical protein [Persephonella sp.]